MNYGGFGTSRCLQNLFCSSLCCVTDLPREEKRSLKKEKNGFPAGGPAAVASPQSLGFWGCYVL
jgi:hypothetical protein